MCLLPARAPGVSSGFTLGAPAPPPCHPAAPVGGRRAPAPAGASVGGSADVGKQGPTHTARVSVSPGGNTIMQIVFLAPAPPRPWPSCIFIPRSEVNVHPRRLRICILFTLKCPGAVLKQDSPFRRATSHINS